MDEFSFIDSIQPSFYKQSSLIKGISDDAAVFRQTSKDIVTAVDTMVEGIHFSRKTMAPFHVGYRALAANLSDLAAMGSMPAFYLASIVIPPDWTESELQELYSGMRELAGLYHIDLIGGDTVSGKELTVSITVIGYVERNQARYRSSAKPGDILFVTGTLGDSRAGLECLLHSVSQPSLDRDYFVNRHRQPTPRVNFACSLASLSRVALNDISDGISSEASEIAVASEVDVHIDMDKLPFVPSLRDMFAAQYREWVLSGGEDFELLGCVSPVDWPKVQELAKEAQIQVSEIGKIQESKGEQNFVYVRENGKAKILNKSGYTHLQGERKQNDKF